MSTITKTQRRAVEPHKLTRAAEQVLRDAAYKLAEIAIEADEGTCAAAEAITIRDLLCSFIAAYSQK